MYYINNIYHYFKYIKFLQTLWTINEQYCVYTVNEHETRWINAERNYFGILFHGYHW